MKHLHMLMAVLTIGVFLSQAIPVWAGRARPLSKGLKIATHVLYTLLIVTGIITVMPLLQAVGLPHWVIGKVILLVVAVSATIKALRPTTPAVQAKVGMFVALIAYVGIIILAYTKPMNLF